MVNFVISIFFPLHAASAAKIIEMSNTVCRPSSSSKPTILHTDRNINLQYTQQSICHISGSLWHLESVIYQSLAFTILHVVHKGRGKEGTFGL